MVDVALSCCLNSKLSMRKVSDSESSAVLISRVNRGRSYRPVVS